MIRGQLSDLRGDGSIRNAECLAEDLAAATLDDADPPPRRDGFYYLARGQNDCPGGTGTYGERSDGVERGRPQEPRDCD